MPDPVDMIVPMLQRLQTDMSEVKQDTRSVKSDVADLKERFEAFGPYLTYHMGLYSQNRVDIDHQAQEIASLKTRVDVLEAERRQQ